jgi:hypothetical protein
MERRSSKLKIIDYIYEENDRRNKKAREADIQYKLEKQLKKDKRKNSKRKNDD